MSSRNFRKLCGNSLPPPNSDESDGDYDPLSNRGNQRSTYEGLELSSGSESVRDPEIEEDDQDVTESHGGARKKKPQKKKGKGKKSKTIGGTGHFDEIDDVIINSSDTVGQGVGQRQHHRRRQNSQSTTETLDEIDKSIMEVNALLGTPPPASPQPVPMNQDPINILLNIHPKHLNVSNELRRLFGPEDPEEIKLRTRNQPYRARQLKRVMIGPTNDTTIYEFKKTGLSMSIEKREQDVTYFVYDHDQHYQKIHRMFLQKYAQNYMRPGSFLSDLPDYRKKLHVEPMLEIADTLFRMDENGLANELIENLITYLQYVAPPSFNLSRSNVRLLFAYRENRPFHVAMLKYLYLLTNKACHRTALEIAKMLLNIDPSDPLAVLFVIDTLALRAREHKWLIEAIDYFSHTRQANMMFNIQYSYGLAHFHVALKTKSDFSEADKCIQFAIISYPEVVPKILEFANVTEPRIQTHTLFTTEPRVPANGDLNALVLIYAKLTWSRWREPQVMAWLLKNAIEVAENYDNSEEVRKRALDLGILRHNIFQAWPAEIARHVAVLDPMANLILETPLHLSRRPAGSSWDPLFDNGINRYGYSGPTNPPRNIFPGGRALLYRFFTSIMPNTELEPPVDD